jgi:hypothetical protein
VQAPRIVIHVGAPKTGSSYLQTRLRTAPEVWRAHGVYVPVLPEMAQFGANAWLLSNVLGRSSSAKELDATDAPEPREVVARLLDGWQADREVLVLSAESLRPWKAQPLRDVLPAEAECTPVLFVRNQNR